tara:strand:+ start:12771 stop:13505 length:735 start_codon:yes stop_codon:yes gene_type:complete
MSRSSLKTSNIKKCNDDNDCLKLNKFKIKYHCDKVRNLCTKTHKNPISFSENEEKIFNSSKIEKFIKEITFFNINSYIFLTKFESNFEKVKILLKEKNKNQDKLEDLKNRLIKFKKHIESFPGLIIKHDKKIEFIDRKLPKLFDRSLLEEISSNEDYTSIIYIKNELIERNKLNFDIYNKNITNIVRNIMTSITSSELRLKITDSGWESLNWNDKFEQIKKIFNSQEGKKDIPTNLPEYIKILL